MSDEKLTRQQLRARGRQYDKAIAKMEKLEATTQRLIELGAMKKKNPITKRLGNLFKRVFG